MYVYVAYHVMYYIILWIINFERSHRKKMHVYIYIISTVCTINETLSIVHVEFSYSALTVYTVCIISHYTYTCIHNYYDFIFNYRNNSSCVLRSFRSICIHLIITKP